MIHLQRALENLMSGAIENTPADEILRAFESKHMVVVLRASEDEIPVMTTYMMLDEGLVSIASCDAMTGEAIGSSFVEKEQALMHMQETVYEYNKLINN